ncbi:hypothetical protein GCM10029978_067930 [Actinoallomurus acanthiterrae]
MNPRRYAEHALLGALLLDWKIAQDGDAWPAHEMFYNRSEQELYQRIAAVIRDGTGPSSTEREPLAIEWARILRARTGKKVPPGDLMRLMEACPRVANARWYARAVVEAHVMRVIGKHARGLAAGYERWRSSQDAQIDGLWPAVTETLERVGELSDQWDKASAAASDPSWHGGQLETTDAPEPTGRRDAVTRRARIEVAFVGSILHHKGVSDPVWNAVQPDRLYDREAVQIYNVLISLREADTPITPQSMFARARDIGLIPDDAQAKRVWERFITGASLSSTFLAYQIARFDRRRTLEDNLIAALLQNPGLVNDIRGVVAPEDFITPGRDVLYAAIGDLRDKGWPADAVLLSIEAQRLGLIGEILRLSADEFAATYRASPAEHIDVLVKELTLRSSETAFVEAVMDLAATSRDPRGTAEKALFRADESLRALLDGHYERTAQNRAPGDAYTADASDAGNGAAAPNAAMP